MTERSPSRKPAAKTGASTPTQAAATPKPKRQPPKSLKPQRAAVPNKASGARRHSGSSLARQDPPIPADLITYFGGQEYVDLIVKECVPTDASASDVLRLLLEARRLGADPLRHDVYLARGTSRDGAAFEYAVAARRDALLAYAERQPGFRGFDADAVYEGDRFERAEPTAEGTLRQRAGIIHTRGGVPSDENATIKGAVADGTRPAKLLKAWCVVDRADRPPLTFEALASEYLPDEDVKAMNPDDPRRRYPDRYLVKVAMCWPLRMAFGLNDVVGAEELSKRPDPLPDLSQPAGQAAAPAVFSDVPTDDLDARILDVYTQAQALDKLMWPPAKVSARLASARWEANNSATAGGATLDRLREELAAEIERDVAAENVRRRDPVANARRLAELRAFDTTNLDADDLTAYRTELAAVEAAVEAAASTATA